jgi:hypothetical protein
MPACARVALVLMALSATFGLAGCAAVDELRDTILRWVESEKLPSGRGAFADDLPDATPVVSPEKPAKANKKSRKHDKSARKLQRPQSVVLTPKRPPISASPESTKPDETEGAIRDARFDAIAHSFSRSAAAGNFFTLKSATVAGRPAIGGLRRRRFGLCGDLFRPGGDLVVSAGGKSRFLETEAVVARSPRLQASVWPAQPN